jgi:hypothetical protein
VHLCAVGLEREKEEKKVKLEGAPKEKVCFAPLVGMRGNNLTREKKGNKRENNNNNRFV